MTAPPKVLLGWLAPEIVEDLALLADVHQQAHPLATLDALLEEHWRGLRRARGSSPTTRTQQALDALVDGLTPRTRGYGEPDADRARIQAIVSWLSAIRGTKKIE